MSWDTKYRPLLFEEVIGQDGTIDILKQLVQDGEIFHKSYIFAGPSGTGKTTIARILARAMLCDNVQGNGEPCNECESCQEIIEGSSSFSFVEMDAANNSGVDTIRQMVEEIDYYTLDGKDRRIYLIDECHRLSRDAMDALLKPMEDNIPGSKDKRLVCLFCTTEPEKLRDTIKARCMMFGIEDPEREEVVSRLRYICEQEDVEYTEEGLDIIFSYGKRHIRDMVTALERVSRVGSVTPENVRDQLGLGAVSNYYRIVKNLRDDLPEAISLTEETLKMVDPSTLYEGLADASLASYRISWDITEGIGYVDRDQAREVYEKYGDDVLWIANRILDSYKKIDSNVLVSELVLIHRYLNDGTIFSPESVNDHERSASPARASHNKQSDSSETSDSDDANHNDDDDDDESDSGKTKDRSAEYANDVLPNLGDKFLNDRDGEEDSSSDSPSGNDNEDDFDVKSDPSNIGEVSEDEYKNTVKGIFDDD